jgi:hypothetical protein
MNTGQMLLAVGAMILLATIILRVNNSFMASDEVLDQSKYCFLASSIATSIIQEAKNLAFDRETVDTTVVGDITDPSLLTPLDELKWDTGESSLNRETFDDFDDFNSYTYTDSTMPSAVFNVSCRVEYVDESNPSQISSVPTFSKIITVTVSSPFMTDVVQLSSIFSFWFFR